MGLDMYLSARKTFSGSSYQTDEKKAEYAKILDAAGLKDIDVEDGGSRFGYFTTTVIYWRKSNAIHRWFVQHVQDGTDNCAEYDVEREHLEALQRDLTTALTNKGRASRVMPTVGGFFFGGTEYDEWYWKDLRRTLNAVNHLLTNPRFADAEFTYQSSW